VVREPNHQPGRSEVSSVGFSAEVEFACGSAALCSFLERSFLELELHQPFLRQPGQNADATLRALPSLDARSSSSRKRLAVDHDFQLKRNRPGNPNRCAVLGGVNVGGDVVPCLHRILGPTHAIQKARSGELDRPILDFALAFFASI